MIKAANLQKRFGALVAVDGVSFEIKKGETLGLLGPNGAGKTTTIHMLVGALRPDAGEIAVDGQFDPTRAEVRRRLGVAPQKLSLYDELTGEENLNFFGSLYGLRGDDLRKRTEWGLSFAGLSDRRRDRVGHYSGGMQRRLNLACALAHDPPALFLDEPTVGVDPQSRNHLFDSIERLKSNGLTLLYTTHYMEEAERLCDRVAIMDHGRIMAVDTVDALLRQHGGKSRITAELSAPASRLTDLPNNLAGNLDGNTLTIDSAAPLEDVARLGAAGVSFSTLRIDKPNLESVFLSLTGRRLRD